MVYVRRNAEVSQVVSLAFCNPDIARVHAALGAHNLRIVGGTMRDIFLGRTPSDLDFSTPLKPMEVKSALAEAGIKVHYSKRALAHGTLSVKFGGRVIEITTLRRDEATDGRHARVEFTQDWAEDAGRRDFTINAIYGGYDGTIYDWYGGVGDMKRGKLKFIGDADKRVAEDALRVLRYFRFMATLGWTDWDESALAACCTAAKNGALAGLSVERLWHELSRILAVSDPKALRTDIGDMQGAGVLQAVLGEDIAVNPDWGVRLGLYDEWQATLPLHLKEAMVRKNIMPTSRQDAVARLGLIVLGSPERAQKRFRLERRDRIETRDEARFESVTTWNGLCQDIHDSDMGRESVPGAIATALLAGRLHCIQGASPLKCLYEDMVRAALEWQDKRLPINGNDLRKMGITEGAQVGVVKREVREWWYAKDREPERDACLSYAGARIAAKHAPLDNPAV